MAASEGINYLYLKFSDKVFYQHVLKDLGKKKKKQNQKKHRKKNPKQTNTKPPRKTPQIKSPTTKPSFYNLCI